MLLPVHFVANWAQIRQRRQHTISESNRRENAKRLAHEYRVGDHVTLATPGLLPKAKRPRTGLYKVTQIHDNGTLTIEDGPIQQRVNIRRVTPYWKRD